jgi:hypothetical protein
LNESVTIDSCADRVLKEFFKEQVEAN